MTFNLLFDCTSIVILLFYDKEYTYYRQIFQTYRVSSNMFTCLVLCKFYGICHISIFPPFPLKILSTDSE